MTHRHRSNHRHSFSNWLVFRLGLLSALSIWFLVVPAKLHSQVVASQEYQLKAAFLYNFIQFVQWPAITESAQASPFMIGILGEDPFGEALDRIVHGERIHGRELRILRSNQLEKLTGCSLLFICKSEKTRVREIISQSNSLAMLTVSDFDGFIKDGGIINFYPAGNKLRFEINPSAAESHGLKLSSQLLSLGRIVQVAGDY